MSKVAMGLCMWPLCKENNGSNVGGLYGRLYCEKHAQVAEERGIAKLRDSLKAIRATHCRNCSDEQWTQCYNSNQGCLDVDRWTP